MDQEVSRKENPLLKKEVCATQKHSRFLSVSLENFIEHKPDRDRFVLIIKRFQNYE